MTFASRGSAQSSVKTSVARLTILPHVVKHAEAGDDDDGDDDDSSN